jgi:hypothetical protein
MSDLVERLRRQQFTLDSDDLIAAADRIEALTAKARRDSERVIALETAMLEALEKVWEEPDAASHILDRALEAERNHWSDKALMLENDYAAQAARIKALEAALRSLNAIIDNMWNDPLRYEKAEREKHAKAICAAQLECSRALEETDDRA